MVDGSSVYDVAVSFSGAQRTMVEEFVRACQALGLNVFYDRDRTVDLWGRNILTEFRKIYGSGHTRYVVPFISSEYLETPYPRDELKAAISEALNRDEGEYILPIRVGEADIPQELIDRNIGYLQAEDHSPAELAANVFSRARGNSAPRPQEREAQPPTLPAPAIRLPQLTPAQFNKRRTLQEALTHLGNRFAAHKDSLAPYGYSYEPEISPASVRVQVERGGEDVCELHVRFDDSPLTSGGLAISFDWPRGVGSGMNGHATAEWDPVSGGGKIRYTHFSGLPENQNRLVSADEFFEILWGKIVAFLDGKVE